MTGVVRKGVSALLVAYVVLLVVVAAVAAVVLLGRDKTVAVIDLAGSAPVAPVAATAPPPSPAPLPAAPATRPEPPRPILELAPPPPSLPLAAPVPLAPPAPIPTAVEPANPAAPEPVAAPPPAPSPAADRPAPGPTLTSIYPPPPPEKPRPPARTAAAATGEAAATPAGRALTPAALLEPGPHGALPRIARDGRLPWIVNNGRFDHSTRQPRLGVVVTGLGLNAQVTEDAIVQLPAEITLAFVPYAENLPRWIQLAREFGHEVLISLPLESDGPADAGLGPRMLTLKHSAGDNLDRLRWVLSRGSGYVGVVTWEGETFLASVQQSVPVLQELAQRGLLVLDSRQARSNVVQQHADELGLPFAKSRGFLDSQQGAAALDDNLQQLEAIGQRAGFGVAMAVAFPDTVRRLADWSKTVGQRGFVLAPITGVTECRELCQQRVARHAAAVSGAQR